MTEHRDDISIDIGPNAAPVSASSFAATLTAHGLRLVRGETRSLQVNAGFLCDLRCRHCHLEAGPGRQEVMSRGTMAAVMDFAKRFRFPVVDITGGAPEMVPDLPFLVECLPDLTPRLMLRTNLSALATPGCGALLPLCIRERVVLIASFPSTNVAQADAQRGAGVAEAGISALQALNAVGYGREGTGLELNLVSNPVGAFLPAAQPQVEKKFRRDLFRTWGITFDNLYIFGNVPLGRFRKWLIETGSYDRYLRTLADGFNPCTVEGLMCRTQLSVAWDGSLYDCDFNLAAGRPLQDRRAHVSELSHLPVPGTPIAIGDYCYACTAGSGFT